MPLVDVGDLRRLVSILFKSAGCNAEEATIVAEHLVGNNLVGHDSHGVALCRYYLDKIRAGTITVDCEPTVLRERGPLSVLEGHLRLGQVLGQIAMGKAIKLASEYGIGCVGVRHCSHVGRLGAFVEMAAEAGMVGAAMCNWAREEAMKVAPFGGRAGKLSTNPLAWAFPTNLDYPLVVDFATSVVAGGKIRLYEKRGEAMPEGWVINGSGKFITDPRRYMQSNDAVLLPFGGEVGYKGFGLSLIVEALAGGLTGHGMMSEGRNEEGQGFFVLAIDIEGFRPLHEFKDEIAQLSAHVKSGPTMPNVSEVQIPGEIEYRTRKKREKSGIKIEANVWEDMLDYAHAAGINTEKVIESSPCVSEENNDVS